METPDTEWKIRIREYLNESREYVGETDDLESVCLDGYFNLEEIAQIIISSQRAHWLRSEIEKLEGVAMKNTKDESTSDWFYGYGWNHALTSIITRYKEELLELKK